MNDDRFMHSLRKDPDPGFARDLRNRLASGAAAGADAPRPRRLAPALAFATVGLAALALFLFPSVRASAQAFIDLFRVRNFVAVSIDPAKIEASLKGSSLDFKNLLSDQIQVVESPGRPRPVPSTASAGRSMPPRVTSATPV